MVAHRRRAYGFTLVELMVTLAIAGILMAIGVPSMKTLLNVQKMKSATFDLVTTAMQARSEAIKWSGASSSSISIVAPSNNFSNGWCIVFTTTSIAAADYCSTTVIAAKDVTMQMIKPTSGVTYAYQGVGAPIVFTRSGRLLGGIAVTIRLTDDDGMAMPRCVTIDTNGNARVRVMATAATAC